MKNTEGLYDRGYLINFSAGELVVYRTPVFYTSTINDEHYVIKDGESLLDIAREKYGSSNIWFILADVNDNVEDIFDLPVGEVIVIPNLDRI